MITTSNASTVSSIHGTRLRIEPVVSMYARAWKQRPAGPVLGGFDTTDNSTGVSAVERRRR